MKICILGNSHLASIKLGWEESKSLHVNYKVDFFGAPSKNLKNLRQDGHFLITDDEFTQSALKKTSKGREKIHLDDYDAFLIVGSGFGIVQASIIMETHGYIGEQTQIISQYTLSESCFQDALSDSLKNSTGMFVYNMICESIDKKNVFLLEQAYPTKQISQPNQIYNNSSKSNLELANKIYIRIKKQMSAKSINILCQPVETKDGEIHTREKYSIGSVRLLNGNPHPETDFMHMNEQFGKLALLEFFKHLNKKSTTF